VPATLRLLAELDPSREVAVCRELTKVHEEVVRGSAAELAARYEGAPPRGEVVLVVGPSAHAEVADSALVAAAEALEGLVEAGARARAAAAIVGRLTGTSANAVYRAYTELRGG
jgi:16S rRNA (cytidine1402-2'-O)-methyltransferase